jgi:hypothetical protein
MAPIIGIIPKITGGSQYAFLLKPVAINGDIIDPIRAIILAVPIAMFLMTVGKSSPP